MPIASLRPSLANNIFVAKKASATVVRGITILGSSAQAMTVGKRLKVSAIRGIQIGSFVDPIEVAFDSNTFRILTCGSVTEDLYETLRPLAYADDLHGDALWHLCCAIAGQLQDIEDLSRDDDPISGWAKLVDLGTVPSYAIDWLGQMVGVRPSDGLTAQQKKDRVEAKSGFSRGTPAAMRAAAQIYLSGNKTVNITERDTSPYHVSVSTYLSETPQEVKVLEALISQKPAGIVLSYSTTPGQSWAQLLANHPTWTLVNSDYSTWNEVLNDTP